MKRKLKKEINQEIRDVKSKIFSLEKEYVALSTLDLPEVKEAIDAGWCEVKYSKKQRTTEEIQADIEACKIRLSELEIEEKYTFETLYNLYKCDKHGIYAVKIDFNDKTCTICKSKNKMLSSDEINNLLNIK